MDWTAEEWSFLRQQLKLGLLRVPLPLFPATLSVFDGHTRTLRAGLIVAQGKYLWLFRYQARFPNGVNVCLREVGACKQDKVVGGRLVRRCGCWDGMQGQALHLLSLAFPCSRCL